MTGREHLQWRNVYKLILSGLYCGIYRFMGWRTVKRVEGTSWIQLQFFLNQKWNGICRKSLPIFFQSTSWQLVLCCLWSEQAWSQGLVWFFFPSRTTCRFPLSPVFNLCPVISLSLESVVCRHFVSCKAEVIFLYLSENVAYVVTLF